MWPCHSHKTGEKEVGIAAQSLVRLSNVSLRLSDVRKSFALTDDHHHSPSCEEISAWKSVIRQLPETGTRSPPLRSSVSADKNTRRKPHSRMTKPEVCNFFNACLVTTPTIIIV